MNSLDLQNLRLDPILRAGGFVRKASDAPKVHAWRNTNKLQLGREVEGGNRRYDLADASRLLLMRQLMAQLLMPVQAAVDLVNVASEAIQLHAMKEYFVVDHLKPPPLIGDMAIDIYRVDGSLRPEIGFEDELGKWDSAGDLVIRPPRVYLKPLVSWARNNLIDAVGGDSFAFLAKLREATGEAV